MIRALPDPLQGVVPAVLRPAATFGEALALFGVGAAVALRGEIAGKVGKRR